MKKILFIIFYLSIINSIYSQWEYVSNGISSNYVLCFATKGDTIFVGTALGGVFMSTNNGLQWTAKNNGITDLEIRTLLVDGNNIYAGTYATGIFKSTNNGNNWSAANVGLGELHIKTLTKFGIYIFVGTMSNVINGPIYRSSDNGNNWISCRNGIQTSASVNNSISNSNGIFLGTGSADGVYFSSNSGTNWLNQSSGLPLNSYIYSIGRIGDIVFVGARNAATPNIIGMYKTTNNGIQWNSVNSGLPSNFIISSIASDGVNLFCGPDSNGVYISTNAGATWIAKNQGLTALYIGALITNSTYVFGGSAGVWRRSLLNILTSVEKPENKFPMNYNLSQNYPNPFNSSTSIYYNIPQKGIVRIAIFDVLGREVGTLINEIQSAGIYKTTFDASNYSSGVYYYKLLINDFSQVKRMVLLK